MSKGIVATLGSAPLDLYTTEVDETAAKPLGVLYEKITLRRIPETKSNTIVVDIVFVACKVRRGQATMTEKFANCFAPRQAQVPCCFERGIIIHWKYNDCSKCCSSFMLSYSFILNQEEAVPASFVYLYSLLLSGIREFLFPFRLSGCRAMLS